MGASFVSLGCAVDASDPGSNAGAVVQAQTQGGEPLTPVERARAAQAAEAATRALAAQMEDAVTPIERLRLAGPPTASKP